jgi:hypothetical protein
MCQMPLYITQIGFFLEKHEFHQLSWIGLFETQWTLLHLENSDFQELFLSKPTQFSQRNNVLEAHASNTDDFLSGGTCGSLL